MNSLGKVFHNLLSRLSGLGLCTQEDGCHVKIFVNQTIEQEEKRWLSPIDISSCRKVSRIATNVDMVQVLVDADVINFHPVWESEMFEVNVTEVFRHAQVDNDVLAEDHYDGISQRTMRESTIGSCDTGRADI